MLARFARLGAARKALLIEAAGRLLLARAALAMLPFRIVASRLGDFVAPLDGRIRRVLNASPAAEEIRVAREIGWAVACAARHMPFRAVCLSQAMAARAMLERRGVPSVMRFGAAAGTGPGKPIETHAWLDAAGVKVTGYPAAHEFTEIASFVHCAGVEVDGRDSGVQA